MRKLLVIWETTEIDAVFVCEDEDEPNKFSQGQLNNLVRDLESSKDKSWTFSITSQRKCLFNADACITHNKDSTSFFLCG